MKIVERFSQHYGDITARTEITGGYTIIKIDETEFFIKEEIITKHNNKIMSRELLLKQIIPLER